MFGRYAPVLFLLVTWTSGLAAASMQIGRIEQRPSLDAFADMSAPPVVMGMARVEGFIQRTPHNGAPVSERTAAYAGYDDTTLYFVFVAHDRRPDQIRARLVNRDLIPGDDDTVSVMLDTFYDRKRCYGFQVNASGVQNDAIWTEGATWDFSHDAVWTSEARITGSGYVAMIAIPFKSLRFPPSEMQRWGIFLYRGIPRNNEEVYWPAYSSDIAGRLNQAGDLVGLQSVSPGRNLQFIPYTSFLGARTPVRTRNDTQVGVDGKMIFRDSIVADVTVNPDFGQVESDVPQETLIERFEVFFPEKRPFFIENASYFDTPLQLLFTRRIGDPQHGAKVTGKAGRLGIGALLIDDRAPGELASPLDPRYGKSALFGALRVTHDVGSDSSVGATYIRRSLGEESNDVSGVDARLRLNRSWIAAVQGVASSTTGLDGERTNGRALYLKLAGSGTNANYDLTVDDTSDDFRAEAGFIPRVGVRNARQNLTYRFRPQGRALLAWGPDLTTRHAWEHDGNDWLEHTAELALKFELPRLTTAAAGCVRGSMRLIPREVSSLDEPLSLRDRRCGIEVQTSALPRTTAFVNVSGGTYVNFVPAAGLLPYNADFRIIEMTIEFHPTGSLTLQNNLIDTRLSSPDRHSNAWTHRVVRTKLGYQFSRQFSARVILTDDRLTSDARFAAIGERHRLNADLLLTYLLSPGTALYAGYNSNYATEEGLPLSASDLRNDHRQLFMKVSYLLRF